MPVSGWEPVRSLVTDVGLDDPEDANVNCILEALRATRELRDERESAVVAVVSGGGDSAVGADRSIAAQLDELVEQYDPDSAIVVLDSAEDERALPIVESRLPVDSVDRVVVRQARDIESTYYLLKQFLADEELRKTLLVPLGVALLALPVLLLRFSITVAVAGLAALLGAVLLYKGIGVDEHVAVAAERGQEALYAGQVSVVTYVVAAGLTLVGLFVGGLAAADVPASSATVVPVMEFAYRGVPWLAVAALTAALGRLLDELIREEGVREPYLNLPFLAVAVGLVVRGFAGYFLQSEEALAVSEILGVTISPGQRLAVFIVTGILISAVGVRFAADVSDDTLEGMIDRESERRES